MMLFLPVARKSFENNMLIDIFRNTAIYMKMSQGWVSDPPLQKTDFQMLFLS